MGRSNYWHIGGLLIFICLLRIMCEMVFTVDILAEQPDDYWLIDNTSSSAKIHSNRESSTIEKHMIKLEESESMVQKLSTKLYLTQSHLQRIQKDKNSTLANVQKLQMKMVETEKKLGQANVKNVKLQRDKHDLEDQIKQKASKFNYDPAKSENVVQYFGPLWPKTFWPTKKPREVFGSERFDNCRVDFKDKSMATCHLAAFGGNFGDMLGPDIVKRAVEYRFGCDASNIKVVDFSGKKKKDGHPGPCLFTVGSVWRTVRPNDHLFGTGMLGVARQDFNHGLGGCKEPEDEKFTNVTVYSVRGPLSVEKLRKNCQNKFQVASVQEKYGGLYDHDDEKATAIANARNFNIDQLATAGDPGFLVPFLFPEILPDASLSLSKPFSHKRNKPDCVVLHHYDDEVFTNFGAIINDTTKILPVIQPWKTMTGNITQCRVVSSSSLHGLIIADAYGIPARWIKKSSNVLPFKFDDYAASFGIIRKTHKLINILQDEDLAVPEVKSYSYRSAYAMKIMQNFPFHLFEVTSKPENSQTT